MCGIACVRAATRARCRTVRPVIYDIGRRPRGIVRPSPLFLAVLGVTALGGAIAWANDQPGSRFGDFGVFLFVLGAWVVTVCIHEFAHAYVAYRAGAARFVNWEKPAAFNAAIRAFLQSLP